MPPAHPTRESPFRGWDQHRTRKRRIRGSPAPKHIQEYRMDPAKWLTYRPPGARRRRGAAARLTTVDRVLGKDKDELICLVCQEFDESCDNDECRLFWARGPVRRVKKCLEIRHTGSADLGYGVYVKPGRQILKDRYLGEYMGELIPPGTGDDLYTFDIPNVARVSADTHGNVSRFFNHSCDPNIAAHVELIGGRQAVVFRALRNINAGEQILVDYGEDYFADNDMSSLEFYSHVADYGG